VLRLLIIWWLLAAAEVEVVCQEITEVAVAVPEDLERVLVYL